MAKAKDITGQRFGRLVAIKKVGKNKDGQAKWLCKCDCGEETVVLMSSLTRGLTRSCGCYRSEIKTNDITGQRFGRLVAIKKIKSVKIGTGKAAVWLFKCDCGNYTEAVGHQVTAGLVRSCGCLLKETARRTLQETGKFNGSRERSRQAKGIMRKTNTSGVTGVSYDKYLEKWVAQLIYRGVRYRKRFATKEKAIAYRKQLEEELGIYTEEGIKR